MKKEMRKGFLVSLGVVMLLTLFPLSALACHPIEYNGNGGCAGFWLSVKSSDPTTYHWRAQLWQDLDTDLLVKEYSGSVAVTAGYVTVYVPTGANPSDGATWQPWGVTCNGTYYVKLHWDLNGSYNWNQTSSSFTCQTPQAVTLASFTALPTGNAITLDWATASELDNLGFNLYRARSAAGPRTQLNASLILSQVPGSPVGAAYQFVDTAVKPGVTYYYWLEAVDVAGASELYGPVSAAVQGTRRPLPVRPQLAPQPPLTGTK
jgi:hypothetical protein